jgi:photosystem II stability/assembly factor-like uncharacterized protein
MMCLLRFFFFVLAALLACQSPSWAAGRFPAATAVIPDPHDANTLYVRATFGLLATHDGGGSWRWVCERAIGLSGTETPSYAVTPKGTLVAGTASGIAVSRDGGCTFDVAGGPGAQMLTDLAVRTNGEIVAVTSSTLVTSTDDAHTFAVSGGPIDPPSGTTKRGKTLLIEGVQLAASDPARIYLSAARGEGDSRTGALLVSYDAGMSWVERKLDLVAGETAPFVALVDPKAADRVYVRTAGTVEGRSRLLVTDDAGKTWKKLLDSPSPLLGFALSDDGRRLIVGGRDGIQSAPTDTFTFTQGSSVEIQCLGLSRDQLWACSTEKSAFFVGVSKTMGRSFEPKLHLEDIKGPLDCPGAGIGKECTAEWPKVRRELGLPEPGEQPKVRTPAGPALKGRATRTFVAPNRLRSAAGIALVGMAVYFVLKRLKRGRGG